MSSCLIPASEGPAASRAASQASLCTVRAPRAATLRRVFWCGVLLLVGVGLLSFAGPEPRPFDRMLSLLQARSADSWAGLGQDSGSSGLPQVDGLVHRSLKHQSTPARVQPGLGGHALGLGADSRALRKPLAVHLTPEQALLARHIAIEYRRALDFSRELVHHAYQIAREAQVDPLLILAIISVESRFNPLAESPAGAQGLMQVLTRVHGAKFRPFGGIQAAFDPVANLKVGTAILRHYLQSHDTVALALKAYVGAAQAEHDFGYGAKVLAARAQLVEVTLPQDAAPSKVPVRMMPVLDRAPAGEAQDDI